MLPALLSQEAIMQHWVAQPWVEIAYSVFFLSAFCSLLLFYGTAAVESGTLSITKAITQVPLALIVGIGLSLNNSVAVVEALIGRKSAFVRTPKTGVSCTENFARASRLRSAQQCRIRYLLIECVLSVYFLYTLLQAISLGRWHALPFICLFFLGYGMFALQGIIELILCNIDSARLHNTPLKWFRKRKVARA